MSPPQKNEVAIHTLPYLKCREYLLTRLSLNVLRLVPCVQVSYHLNALCWLGTCVEVSLVLT